MENDTENSVSAEGAFALLVERGMAHYARSVERGTEFGLGTHSRWEVPQESAVINFYDASDRCVVTADFQNIGSYSPRSNSWLWAWANPSVPSTRRQRALVVKQYGIEHDMPGFCADARVDLEQDDAHLFAVIAGYLMDAEVIYRLRGNTTNNSVLYAALYNIRRV